jgi:mannose-6-phosphate isomerase-like protein (cupin superfamily)
MEGGVMLKEYLDFERDAGLLEEVAKCYSASCVFADVQYRSGVMHGAIKAVFPAKAVGQALTVQLSKGDLVDPLKALEMGTFWHSHAETDDFSLLLKGNLVIHLRDGTVRLGPGDLYVVPRGVEHRPLAEEEVHLLLIEPRGTPNTGDPATAAVKRTI